MWGWVGCYETDIRIRNNKISLMGRVLLNNNQTLDFIAEFDIHDPNSIEDFTNLLVRYRLEPTTEIIPYAIHDRFKPDP